MIVPLLVFSCLTATFRGIRAEGEENTDTDELGKGINLRKTNILKDFQEKEASLFKKLPSSCFKRIKLQSTGSNFDYYATTKAFYSKMAEGAELGSSLESTFTLGATLRSVVKKVDSKETKVSGMSLIVRALKEKIMVKKDCLNDDETSLLTKHLLRDFEKLPLEIENPWYANSWKGYNVFFETYGSHVVTSVKRGSIIRQTTFAESSKSYSQRDFEVKSCVKFAGPSSVGKVGVEACANISNSEVSSVTQMNTEDKLIVRGGTQETRSALIKKRTKELIEKLMNEAGESDASVEHTFRSVWNILQSRFDHGSDNYIRAVNLQYYYLGYLNYGCRLRESGSIHIQKFDHTRASSKNSPEFECSLAAEGCHSDDDCHMELGWGRTCYCYGKTCVRYESEEQATGIGKITAHANKDEDWKWHGCDTNWAQCDCYNKNIGQRKQVWRMPSRDAPQMGRKRGGQYKSGNPDPAEDLDPDQDREGGSGYLS